MYSALRAARASAIASRCIRSKRVNVAGDPWYPMSRGLATGSAAVSRQFWTTGRVALVTAFTASLTYLIGASEMGTFIQQRARSAAPARQYATKPEMEKVTITP